VLRTEIRQLPGHTTDTSIGMPSTGMPRPLPLSPFRPVEINTVVVFFKFCDQTRHVRTGDASSLFPTTQPHQRSAHTMNCNHRASRALTSCTIGVRQSVSDLEKPTIEPAVTANLTLADVTRLASLHR
jgi:hypothetical protein